MLQTTALSRPFEGLCRTAADLKGRAMTFAHSHPRETIGAGVLAFAVAAVLGGVAHSTPEVIPATPQAAIAPPAAPPLLIRQLAPQQALQVNQQIPIVQGPNPAATPFPFKGDKGARAQALDCLASAVYYEAGSQDADGQRAVAQVVLNRVRHPAFPASVCGVVYQGSTRPTGCQFTFTCDGSLYRQPDSEGWKRAYAIAEAALSGYVFAPVGWATHYHANYVVPYWASTLSKNAIVGAHIFYRWNGGWGQPSAFAKSYAGREPDARSLRSAALATAHVTAGTPSSVAEAIKDIPGAEAIKLAPSMRGDKRVAVRFNLVAREASDDVKHEEYVQKFEASDNLKYALSGDGVADNQAPLGRASAPTAASGAQSGQH